MQIYFFYASLTIDYFHYIFTDHKPHDMIPNVCWELMKYPSTSRVNFEIPGENLMSLPGALFVLLCYSRGEDSTLTGVKIGRDILFQVWSLRCHLYVIVIQVNYGNLCKF